MTTFAKSSFNALSYASFRPSYPPSLYKTILSYHQPPSNHLLDLGCGHGLISRALSPSFTSILATDPSPSMIAQAKSSTSFPNITFRQASAENLHFVQDKSVDMVVAGQAAHWFDYPRVWPELARVVRSGGSVAFWGYKDCVFVDYPEASRVLMEFCYGGQYMGPFWEAGREVVRGLLRSVTPPADQWEGVRRVEYEAESGKGEVLMRRRLKLGEVEGYVRTFSAYVNWKAANDGKGRGDGERERERDVVDRLFEGMRGVEPEWEEAGERWREVEVEVEWGSYILMARRR